MDALHQVTVGTADVEERAVLANGVAYEASPVGPGPLIPTLPGLAPRRICGEVCVRDDFSDSPVPLGLVDLTGLQGCVDTRRQPVCPVLYYLNRFTLVYGRFSMSMYSIHGSIRP